MPEKPQPSVSSKNTSRRRFLQAAGASSVLLAAPHLLAEGLPTRWQAPNPPSTAEPDAVSIPDEGWRMWPDQHAEWRHDKIYLPEDVDLNKLPVNPPTGGWEALNPHQGIPLTLPSTVEQYFWGINGYRPYTTHDYKFAATDHEVKNGNYLGVSWWWREIQIPDVYAGKQILLHIRGARQRAEVYLNHKLVGYSILEELPFECDLTHAAMPGKQNHLAIRITNPGGEMDWVDDRLIQWGSVSFQQSHGFGGLDRALRLSAHGPVRVEDNWVLNTPEVRTVTAFANVRNSSTHTVTGTVSFRILDLGTGESVLADSRQLTISAGEHKRIEIDMHYADAKLWDLHAPNLYWMQAKWQARDGSTTDTRQVKFGFRWFAPEGIGTNALFRLNGRRTRIYTAISWGFWGLNGLWPTPELARREVAAAKTFHLNCLNFHRNVGKEEVFNVQDHEGLLRNMEPGGGKQAVTPVPTPPDRVFSQRYMQAKILHMIRAFRSHPSLTEYILQNEASFNLHNPNLYRILKLMRAEDPSRTIVANDGFVPRSGQAWLAPYEDFVRTSLQGGAGGWWDTHKGPFSDVWNDVYYQSPDKFLYRSTDRTEIVEWGEMKGAASPDNHALLIQQIKEHGGKSYDLRDHEQILAAYEKFLDDFGFRKAFPTASGLFKSLALRAYQSWGQFMENVRICDVNDYSAISGWESTAIENHSGLVDNMRDFKSNPEWVAKTMLPVRPVAKHRHLVLNTGDRGSFDIYLLNDTGKPVTGKLNFTITSPDGSVTRLGEYTAPEYKRDHLSYLVQKEVSTPALNRPGVWRTNLQLNGAQSSSHVCELWVVDPLPHPLPRLRVGVAGGNTIVDKLRRISGLHVEPFSAGEHYDVIVAAAQLTPEQRKVSIEGGKAWKTMKPETLVPVHLPSEVLSALQSGTPLFAFAETDGGAEGYARQMAKAGAFNYHGLVGPQRASWMGSWYFVREHSLYSGMPVNQGMSIHYQVKGSSSDGWRVDGKNVEVIVGYSRDHDRHIGAGTITGRLGKGRYVMHRIIGMHPVFEQRFLANCMAWLARQSPLLQS